MKSRVTDMKLDRKNGINEHCKKKKKKKKIGDLKDKANRNYPK